MKKRITLFLCLLVLQADVLAAEDYYPFSSPDQQTRFQQITAELRCLVCQNQTLAESNSTLASDLREQIYQKIQQGQSNQAITSYLMKRYGEFILYRPPFTWRTLGLWLTPLLLLLAGLSGLIFYSQSQRKNKRE